MGGRFKSGRKRSIPLATSLGNGEGYRCIAIDPPWNEQGGGRIKRGADRWYGLMKTADIIETILGTSCWRPAADSHLWLWTTDNHLPDGMHVMEALGFRFIRTLVWVKQRNGNLQLGLGQYLRGSHELCLFGVRGDFMKPTKAPRSVVLAERTMHSEKPAEAYAVIERVSPGPRLEMFARARREGWDVWGNEV